MDKSIYEMNELHAVLRTVSFIILFNLSIFLINKLFYYWVIIIISIILCVIYFKIYYCKTKEESYDAVFKSVIWTLLFIPIIFIMYLPLFFMYIMLHILISLISAISGMILSGIYERKHFDKQIVDGKWVYYKI